MKLSSITLSGLANAGRMVALAPIALIMRRIKKNVWIITERPDQARDNGYCFFKFLKKNKPEKTVYYVIDKNSKDAAKIERFGNIIQFDSWKHYFYFCL